MPPTEGGVSCHQTVKTSYRLGQVKRRGTVVNVTCDGPLKILVMPDFDAGSDAQTELAETYGSHYPALAKAKNVTLEGAGTITVRPRWTKAALRILGHHRKTRIIIGLGTMRTDGHTWSGPPTGATRRSFARSSRPGRAAAARGRSHSAAAARRPVRRRGPRR